MARKEDVAVEVDVEDEVAAKEVEVVARAKEAATKLEYPSARGI